MQKVLLLSVALLVGVYIYTNPSSTWLNSLKGIDPSAHRGYDVDVVDNFIRRVDNIASDGGGGFYVTLEEKEPNGQVIHILSNGNREVVIDDLDRPDGLRRNRDHLFVVEEVIDGRLIDYNLKTGELKTLTRLNKPEGLTVLNNGSFLVSEDIESGRIVMVSQTGETTELLSGLSRPEAVVKNEKGEIYFTETGAGTVSKYHNGKVSLVAEGLNNPDQLEIDGEGSLWIGEDCRSAKLYKYASSELEVIAEDLFYIQGITSTSNGIYVAEQGRNRVLRFHKRSKT